MNAIQFIRTALLGFLIVFGIVCFDKEAFGRTIGPSNIFSVCHKEPVPIVEIAQNVKGKVLGVDRNGNLKIPYPVISRWNLRPCHWKGVSSFLTPQRIDHVQRFVSPEYSNVDIGIKNGGIASKVGKYCGPGKCLAGSQRGQRIQKVLRAALSFVPDMDFDHVHIGAVGNFHLIYGSLGLPTSLQKAEYDADRRNAGKNQSDPADPITAILGFDMPIPIRLLCGAVLLLCGIFLAHKRLWVTGWVLAVLSAFFWLPCLPDF